MLLSLVFLVVRGQLGLIVPEGQREAAKDLEIVVLRHQLNVLRRQVKRAHFRLSDRLFLAAAARRLPRTRWERFLVTPKVKGAFIGSCRIPGLLQNYWRSTARAWCQGSCELPQGPGRKGTSLLQNQLG
jgi:hypothetical protein